MTPTFVTTGFLLAGAAAAALPIVIHLLLRQRARMQPLGSVRFLKEVVRQHTRRRRIRQWLLLAMRMLAVLLLAALFARPYWDRSQEAGRNQEVVVLVDGSASMQVKSESSATVFQDAVKLAESELSGLDENTAVHLGLFDTRVSDLPIKELGGGAAGDGGTDFAAALAWAHDLMLVSRRANRRVVLITDMQLSGLNRSPPPEFPPDVDVVIRDVGRHLPQNVSIEDCRAVSTEIRPKDPVKVRVRLHNAGALAVKDLQLSISLDGPNGEVRANQRVSLDGGERAQVDFALEKIQTDGVYSGVAKIDLNDDLPIDDQRWLAFEARRPDRLLLVDGQQGRSVYTDETYYLETALRLRTPLGDRPGRSFEVERLIWDDGEGFPSLDGFRAIVLANIRHLSAADAQRLRRYLSDGGNLLVFFGDQLTGEQVSRWRSEELFLGKIDIEPELGPWRITSWATRHPVLKPFEDPQNGDLRRLRFEKLLRVDELDNAAEVLIRADTHPLAIEFKIEKGVAIYVMTAADRDWGDWPQSRLYVPIVRQLLAYLTGQLGERQAVRSELAKVGQSAGIREADGVTIATNLDARELLLQRTSEEDFREAVGLPERDRQRVLADAAASIEPPPGVERPRETWDKFVLVLLLLMIGELLLASRVHI